MDLVIISDTHELHRELDVPPGDILIHAGDWTMFSKSLSAIRDFNVWLGELPHPHKVVIAGNHEYFLESDPSRRSLLSNATVLIDEGVDIGGLRIWGSAVTPLYGGAFGKSSASDRTRHWARIPSDTDVLVTHGPPYGILDCSPGQLERIGDPELLSAAQRLEPLLHVFGHVHGAHGTVTVGETTFVNAALLGVGGGIEQSPVALRIARPRE